MSLFALMLRIELVHKLPARMYSHELRLKLRLNSWARFTFTYRYGYIAAFLYSADPRLGTRPVRETVQKTPELKSKISLPARVVPFTRPANHNTAPMLAIHHQRAATTTDTAAHSKIFSTTDGLAISAGTATSVHSTLLMTIVRMVPGTRSVSQVVPAT